MELGPMAKTVSEMDKDNKFFEDPLCACTVWIENAPTEFLYKISAVTFTQDVGHLMDLKNVIHLIENIKLGGEVAKLTEQAIIEFVKLYITASILEIMRRENRVKCVNNTVPLKMLSYVKVNKF